MENTELQTLSCYQRSHSLNYCLLQLRIVLQVKAFTVSSYSCTVLKLRTVLHVNPSVPEGRNIYSIAKILFFKKGSWTKFLWAPRLWVGRRKLRIHGFIIQWILHWEWKRIWNANHSYVYVCVYFTGEKYNYNNYVWLKKYFLFLKLYTLYENYENHDCAKLVNWVRYNFVSLMNKLFNYQAWPTEAYAKNVILKYYNTLIIIIQ